MEDVSVVVLAGGKGTRLRDLFPDVPKPLVPVAGQPFLYWLTNWIAAHGPRHFVFSTGYMAEQIEAWARDGQMPGIERSCCREEVPLGTGGGLLNCLGQCREWILVVNGDGLVMDGIGDVLALKDQRVDGGLLAVEVDDASRFGSLKMTADRRLTGFLEKVPGRGFINGGLYLFHKPMLQRYFRSGALSVETDLFPQMIDGGEDLRVVACSDAPFIDIGTPETVALAEDFVRTHILKR